MKEDNLDKIRHSLAHLLAMAVSERVPGVKLGIGPVIENGFYYDFLNLEVSPEDLPKLEDRMRELADENIKFEKAEVSIDEAKNIFKGQPFKLELIEELAKVAPPAKPEERPPLTIYKSGNFVDLCAGPHVGSTSEINPRAFKLMKTAGAYWKGDEKNPMLTRIYGIAFEDEKELKDHLEFLEEAEKRDHRKIGKELDLFSFHEEGPGFPFWHPKGMAIYSTLENFIRKENERRGYKEIKTPIILNKKLWETSGHWDKFKEDMYFVEIDNQEFAVKPMNCPGGVLIYKENMHSYRDLPVRFSEFGFVHRHELSGVLHGLFRVRAFTQDDAHSFCTPDQLNDEIIGMVDYAIDIYKKFDFNEYEIFVATRPEKYIGDEKIWDRATKSLEGALESKKIKYGIKEGEGAFYGPKIEFNVKDAIGRNWQLGTIQVDFSMPERLGAVYIDNDGSKKTPVMVHRAILGSLERFIGILIEHYAGALPFWLAPVQALIIPVGEKFSDYGKEILEKLWESGVRAEIDDTGETLGKRIRNAELQKTPYILVVGEKEKKSGEVAVRSHKKGAAEGEPRQGRDEGSVKLEEFLKNIQKLNV